MRKELRACSEVCQIIEANERNQLFKWSKMDKMRHGANLEIIDENTDKL